MADPNSTLDPEPEQEQAPSMMGMVTSRRGGMRWGSQVPGFPPANLIPNPDPEQTGPTAEERVMGDVYGAFESNQVPDYVARRIVAAMQEIGIEFVDHHRDAMTTRGPRIPSTVPRLPIAAYNLGWQEGRDSVTDRLGEPEPDVGYEWVGTATEEMATQAEEPVEHRLMRAYLNGFTDGMHRGAYGNPLDHS